MSLQVWLPLNEDLRNQGLNGVIPTNNGAVLNNAGKIGKCYQFGTAASDITLPATSMTSFTTEASISFWIKILSWNTAYATYFQAGTASTAWNAYTFGILRNNANSNLCFTISNGSSASNANYTTSNLELNTWYHLTFCYKTGHCLIYINGSLYSDYTTTIVPNFSDITTIKIGRCTNNSSYQTNCLLNDFRIYDHCLSQKEIEELAKGLVLHYKLDSIGNRNGNPNLGNTSANYSNQQLENPYTAGSWGGDTGTVTYYMSGGYNNLPYKVYHKTATGSGGIYRKTDNDIIIEAGKTYTFSCWIKSSRNYTESAYGFNINRGSDNYYINYGASLVLTTDWKFFSKTFTATADQAGNYGEMSIIYDDNIVDYYVYYSGFKIEEGSDATEWTDPRDNAQSIIYDSSGYRNNGTINTTLQLSNNTARYSASTLFNGTSSSITIPYKAVNPDGIFTMNLWFYKDALGSKNYETLFGGPSGFEMDTRSGSSTTLSLYMASTRGGNVFSPFNLNEWYMVTMVRDGTNEMYYINGELKKTIEAKSMPNGTYFIGAWSNASGQNYYGNISDFRLYTTCLTEEQILELYHTSTTIDNKGNIYSRELVEI